jgi:hypothetical protein
MPHAKKKLNPLWGMLTEPLFQIIAAVGLLLTGVLNLVGRLLKGLGLGGLVKGLGGLGIDKLLGGTQSSRCRRAPFQLNTSSASVSSWCSQGRRCCCCCYLATHAR